MKTKWCRIGWQELHPDDAKMLGLPQATRWKWEMLEFSLFGKGLCLGVRSNEEPLTEGWGGD